VIKLTVLYGHPKDPPAFESYYNSTHMEIADKIPGVTRWELTRFTGAADGGKPTFYRMAELYFPDLEQMETSLQSPEGMATLNDVPNFATGGVTVMVGRVME
jgi:uncharacterized protein (TIGR02118 family)